MNNDELQSETLYASTGITLSLCGAAPIQIGYVSGSLTVALLLFSIGAIMHLGAVLLVRNHLRSPLMSSTLRFQTAIVPVVLALAAFAGYGVFSEGHFIAIALGCATGLLGLIAAVRERDSLQLYHFGIAASIVLYLPWR